MKLTNEDIAKVFAMYYGSTYKDDFGIEYTVDHNAIKYRLRDSEQPAKLQLTPLSKISDEDAIEVAKIWDTSVATYITDDLVKCYLKEYGVPEIIFIYQYLISKSYAVPLFFAPGHWANSKTAIELGIALEKI